MIINIQLCKVQQWDPVLGQEEIQQYMMSVISKMIIIPNFQLVMVKMKEQKNTALLKIKILKLKDTKYFNSNLKNNFEF